MARLSDHDVRDAEHALRAELALVTGRYLRRMLERGKAICQDEIEQAVKEGRDVDGTTIGRSAAARAAADYFGPLPGAAPHPAIEGQAARTD